MLPGQVGDLQRCARFIIAARCCQLEKTKNAPLNNDWIGAFSRRKAHLLTRTDDYSRVDGYVHITITNSKIPVMISVVHVSDLSSWLHMYDAGVSWARWHALDSYLIGAILPLQTQGARVGPLQKGIRRLLSCNGAICEYRKGVWSPV